MSFLFMRPDAGEDMSTIRDLTAPGFVVAVPVGPERDGLFIHRLFRGE